MKPLLLFFGCLGTMLPSYAADLVDIQDGPTLAAHLRQLYPAEARAEGTLTMINKEEGERLVPFVSKTEVKNGSWKVTYETIATAAVPPERLTVIHAVHGPNVYLYTKAANAGELDAKPETLSGDQACVPFAKSDFWLADLGLEFIHWPKQKLLPPQMRRTRPCKVLESRPAPDSPCPYGKIISWIDNETGGVIMAEGYDQEGRRIKEFEVGSFSKVDGQWQLRDMKIRDLPTRSRTLLKFYLEQD